jgi:hypothetical protein
MVDSFAANLIPLNQSALQISLRLKALLDDPSHLAALSLQAKLRFRQGLDESLGRRAACVDLLAQELRRL